MSPGNWVAIAVAIVILAWIVSWFDEVANGTPAERKAFEAKRAKADAEALLREANQEVTDRPRVRDGTEPLIHKGFPHGH